MGCLTSSPPLASDEKQTIEHIEEPEVKKILILGSGLSGKSTTFEAIKYEGQQTKLNKDAMDKQIEYIQTFTAEIRNVCISTLCQLLKQSQILYKEDNILYNKCHIELTEDLSEAIRCLTDTMDQYDALSENNVDNSMLLQLGQYMHKIWNLPAIQETFKLRLEAKYALQDNMDYFLNKITEIMNEEWNLSKKDYLKSYQRTTGFIDAEYELNQQTKIHLYDVGGQRGERKKWIHCFDNLSCVIFVVGLSDFCKALYEDERRLHLKDSLELWQEIARSKWFRKTPIVLWLNKMDLFREYLKYTPLSICFGDEYKGRDYRQIDIQLVDKVIRGLLPNMIDSKHYIPAEVVQIIACYFDLNAEWLELCAMDGLQFIKQKCLMLCTMDRTIRVFHGSALDSSDVECMMREIHQLLLDTTQKVNGLTQV